jgi:hypothetical protein
VHQCTFQLEEAKDSNIEKFVNEYVYDPNGWVLCSDVQALFPDINAIHVGKFISKHWGDKVQRKQKYFKELVDGVPTLVSKRGYKGISIRQLPRPLSPPSPTPPVKESPTIP